MKMPPWLDIFSIGAEVAGTQCIEFTKWRRHLNCSLTVAFGDEDSNSRYDCTVQRTGAVGTATVDVFLLYDAKSEEWVSECVGFNVPQRVRNVPSLLEVHWHWSLQNAILHSDIHSWSWNFSRPTLSRSRPDQDQDRIKLVSSALETETAVLRTTCLLGLRLFVLL